MTKIRISLVNYLPEVGPRRPKHVVEVLNIYKSFYLPAITGYLSPHGGSSGCGARNGPQYGRWLRIY
jgi:hypothetical protein